jgi:hypothetical protein
MNSSQWESCLRFEAIPLEGIEQANLPVNFYAKRNLKQLGLAPG